MMLLDRGSIRMVWLRLLPVLAAVLVFHGGMMRADAAERIKVPLGFNWGEPMQMVEEALKRAKAQVTERRTLNGRLVITVEGLPDPRLKQALFYFQNETLAEIELQYSDPTWDASKLNAILEQTRRNLDSRHGLSRNIAKQRSMEGDVMQTVIGYQWMQDETSLRVFLYSAERGNDGYRILSYHYRGL